MWKANWVGTFLIWETVILFMARRMKQFLGIPCRMDAYRLGAEDLKKLYDIAPKGTRVYIY